MLNIITDHFKVDKVGAVILLVIVLASFSVSAYALKKVDDSGVLSASKADKTTIEQMLAQNQRLLDLQSKTIEVYEKKLEQVKLEAMQREIRFSGDITELKFRTEGIQQDSIDNRADLKKLLRDISELKNSISKLQ